jgi:unsaturated rhamnogalacturonyl hydrolase
MRDESGSGKIFKGLFVALSVIIARAAHLPQAAGRGWSALKAAVQPDGRLGWLQRVGGRPDAISADDALLYGVGAFQIAGAAMADREAGP